MRKLLFIVAVLFSLNSFAQQSMQWEPTETQISSDGTTEKEFRYLTVGYEQDYKAGKDIISGYTLDAVTGMQSSRVVESKNNIIRNTILYKLVRKESGKIAAFLLVQTREDNGTKSYICIPNSLSSKTMMKQAADLYFSKVSEYKCEQLGAAYSYSWNVLLLLSQTLSN